MIENTYFSDFKNWRWGTLYDCTQALVDIYETLSTYWDAALFSHFSDGVMVRQVGIALTDRHFKTQLDFVYWVCDLVCPIQSWIGGCDCVEHQEQYRLKLPVKCWKKGRRVKTAYDHATLTIAAGVVDANQWAEGAFNSSPEFLFTMILE